MLKQWSWVIIGTMLVTSSLPAFAQEESGGEAGLDLTLRTNAAAMPIISADGSALQSGASHIMLMDYDTGAPLLSKAADQKMYPSSMTKIMTLYLIFEKLKQGTLTTDSQFTVSEKAWRMQGSKMFVPLGGQIGLQDLIRGIAIQSGNDACVVVAEGISGSEAAFANLMNEKAKQLGMTGSNFVDASGWPNANHYTTAHDLALLGQAMIRDFPEYYHYLSEREFTYHGIRQFNRNMLLDNTAMQVDGLKTGHTEAAGYGIVLSAKDPGTGRRLVLVLNGLDSTTSRAQEGERLLSWGFHNFDNLKLFSKGQAVTNAPVWMAGAQEVPLTVANDMVASVPKLGRNAIKIEVSYQSPLIAPVAMGQEVGTVTVTFANGSTMKSPLVAGAAADKLSFFGRIPRALGL